MTSQGSALTRFRRAAPEGAQLALSALNLIGRGSAAGAHALGELFEELGRTDLADVVANWSGSS